MFDTAELPYKTLKEAHRAEPTVDFNCNAEKLITELFPSIAVFDDSSESAAI